MIEFEAMTTSSNAVPQRLTERHPALSATEMVAHLTPPPQFDHASFDSYNPDENFPSQSEARDMLRQFMSSPVSSSVPVPRPKLFGKKKSNTSVPAPEVKQGVYLDGGFGVGKTHLLAALWHATPGRKYFGTFIEYTALVGALGYQNAVNVLTGAKLICIDEFELDDPGDTMIMTRLIGDLAKTGSKFAATSNTPPNALGEGRFAAEDFLREIQAMASHFTTLRIDGEDYRHRDVSGHALVLSENEIEGKIATCLSAELSLSSDGFGDLIHFLATIHPSNYVQLINGLDRIVLTDAYELVSQTDALRFVAFIDRVYDAQIGVYSSGIPLDLVFAPEMLDGGYRKKYLRCMSRLVALTTNPETD